MKVTVTVNGTERTADVESRLLLVHLLRETLGLTGTHIGCDTSNCGACTVLLDGTPVKSCTMFAVQADGGDVTTVEGLGAGGLHPIQKAFKEEHGLQCGFCTPAMMLVGVALLEDNPDPTDAEVRTLGLDAAGSQSATYFRGTGCANCSHTGFRGRFGIFEIFVIDDEARKLIYEKVPASVLRTRAREMGMRTLREDGVRKTQAGLTTPDEVIRATIGDVA